ncbi:hypothetical protein Tco_0363675 [Tanacetum coccineum]
MDTNGYYESSLRNIESHAEIGQIQNTCTRPVTLKGKTSDRQVRVRNVRPRISAIFATTGDGSGARVIQALQNPSTSSVFLHTEDFNRANSSSSNHCKRTHEDIQATSPTCDMGIARNVHKCDVMVGTTSTGRGVGYVCAVIRNSGEGSSFVHNEGPQDMKIGRSRGWFINGRRILSYVKEMVDMILQVLRPVYISDDDQIRSSTARIFGIVSKAAVDNPLAY